jgi:ABC-2 type transport system ATP-binding protein
VVKKINTGVSIMPVIEVNRLSKKFCAKIKQEGLSGSFHSLIKPKYREVEAVKDIDLKVDRGEILAFIGPNGAGKSTTIKMLTGILYPTAGNIDVLGLNPTRNREQLAFRIGSVFGQKSQLWFHLPPMDSLRLLGGIFEIPKREFQNRLSYLTEIFELGDLMTVPVRKLSLGQRVRCEIAASLLHRPEIIFLDEPTIGLDVVVKKKIRDLILYLNREEKTTIFLTSHDAGDIEKLCRRAIIINNGTVVLNDSVNNLKHNYLNKKLIDVRFNEPVTIDLPGIIKLKGDQEGNHITSSNKTFAAKIEVDTQKQNLQQVVAEICSLGEVADINISDLPLEEIIAAIYTQSKEMN